MEEEQTQNSFTKNYLQIINSKYSGLNLTRIQTVKDFYYKQYLDSILPWKTIPLLKTTLFAGRRIIDVGFGGGIPLLPLAYENPSIVFEGVEARRKKVGAVGDIATILGICNIRLFHTRIEDMYLGPKTVLIFRAVGKIQDCLKKVKVEEDTLCFFYKGPNFSPTIEMGKLKGWKVILHESVAIPTTKNRFIIGLETKKTAA